jgi:hypothetical protein
MPLTQVLYPEGLIALNAEIATGLHPKLEARLSNHPAAEWEIKLAEIASYCSVVLDGTYAADQISELGHILAGRLEVLRELPRAQTIILS